jgi:hypothetical protein
MEEFLTTILETKIGPNFSFTNGTLLLKNNFGTGLLNSFFFYLYQLHLLTVPFLLNGIPAAIYSGTIGQFLFLSCVLFGLNGF